MLDAWSSKKTSKVGPLEPAITLLQIQHVDLSKLGSRILFQPLNSFFLKSELRYRCMAKRKKKKTLSGFTPWVTFRVINQRKIQM